MFCSPHHLGRLVVDKAPVWAQAGISGAVFDFLYHVRPNGSLISGLFQAADIPFKLLVFGLLSPAPVFFIPKPGRKSPTHQLRPGLVQSQDVAVYTAVQKGSVVGYQEKAAIQLPKVVGHQRSAWAIQMVGGLVEHRVRPLVKKEDCQQGPSLFAAAESGKGTIQPLLPHVQLGQLSDQPPLLPRRYIFQQDIQGPTFRMRHRPGQARARLAVGNSPDSL